MEGRTYRFFTGKPLYPFGFGLSYSTFEYSKLSMKKGTDGKLWISAARAQYIAKSRATKLLNYTLAPRNQLRGLTGFRRVHLAAGETSVVSWILDPAEVHGNIVTVAGAQPQDSKGVQGRHCIETDMRCELEFFNGAELHLLYMARRLREALAVEMLLSQAEVEYFVEPGPYQGGLIFTRELTGAFFYVVARQTFRARAKFLSRGKYKPYEQTALRQRLSCFRFRVAQILRHLFRSGISQEHSIACFHGRQIFQFGWRCAAAAETECGNDTEFLSVAAAPCFTAIIRRQEETVKVVVFLPHHADDLRE